MWSLRLDINSNKCEQTSRAVDGSEIQTGCYIKAGASAHYLPLASSWCFSWIRPHFTCFVFCTGCFDSYFSYYLGHCLRQYLFPSPPQLLHVQGHVHHQQLSPNGVLPTQLNAARYKKTVSAIAWVQLGLFVCYLPFGLHLTSMYFGEFREGPVFFFLRSLFYLNSSLNPFLYCWKIREVKQAVKDTIRQLNCCCGPN